MKLFILSHPDTTSFVFVRREDVENFVKSNSEIWISREVDARKFTIEEALLADKTLLTYIEEARPELLL